MKLPFACLVLDDAPVEVTNPFSGESCMLTPESVAVYDSIRGAEMIGNWTIVRQGVDWFIENFPAEYMILLD